MNGEMLLVFGQVEEDAAADFQYNLSELDNEIKGSNFKFKRIVFKFENQYELDDYFKNKRYTQLFIQSKNLILNSLFSGGLCIK